MKYQRVLVTIDDSDISQLALQEAIRLARRLEARLCIVHGIDAVTTNAYKRTDREEFLAPQIAAGQAILERAGSAAREAGLESEERLIEVDTMGRGRLPELVTKEATEWEADLIVVGTHGRKGMSLLLQGSVAEGIVRIATRPVLVVPDPATEALAQSDRVYTNMIVAVDGTETSEPALQEAIGIARELGLNLRVVYAATPENGDNGDDKAMAILDAALSKAREAGIDAVAGKLESNRQASAIADAVAADAAAWPAHLIVLATHGRQGLDRLRMGSVAEAIFRVSPAPVLLVRAAVPAEE
ncbi:MAG: universal stress protein [Candidatus Thiodiazotropha sp.]